MNKITYEKQREYLIKMRNAVLFTLAATSINPNNVFADTYVEAIKVEKSLKAVKLDLEQNSFIKEQVQLFIDKETAKFVDFYQSKILDVNEYFTEQLLPTRTMIGDILVNKIELKEEEILPEVLNHYHMNEADYNSLVKYIMESSSEQEIHWNERAEITKMLYMSSTIPNAKKLETVLNYYNLSYNEFMTYSGVVSAEARKVSVNGKDAPCYVDATTVATNITGRVNSRSWSLRNVCAQVSAGRQYQVYYEGTYRKYMNENHTGFQAALDVMYHNILCKENGLPLLQPTVWLEFACNGHPKGGTQVVPRGNMYRIPQRASDCIDGYIPTVNPSEIEFKMGEDGEISILLPNAKIATPSNALKGPGVELELKLEK